MSGEVRKPLEGSVSAIIGILILCFGMGILIHILTDHIGRSPTLRENTSRMGKGSVSINVGRFESETIIRIISIIDTYNKAMDLKLKRDIAFEITRTSMRYPNLDVNLVCSIITYSSRKTWDPQIFSSTGALGLMGLTPAIGKFFARYEGIEWTTAAEILLNPIYNIRLGARYLSTLIRRYGLEDGLAVYFMGQKEKKYRRKMHKDVYPRRLKKPCKGVRDGKTA